MFFPLGRFGEECAQSDRVRKLIFDALSLSPLCASVFVSIQALELDPKYVKAWAKKGDIEFFMKEYHKALDSYKMVGTACTLQYLRVFSLQYPLRLGNQDAAWYTH